MRSSPPIAVFDLDGTLADTARDLVATLNVILGQEGVPPLPVEKAGDMISAGGRGLLRRGLGVGGRAPAPPLIKNLSLLSLPHSGETLCVEPRLYPGAVEALERLEAEGFELAICTNKIE